MPGRGPATAGSTSGSAVTHRAERTRRLFMSMNRFPLISGGSGGKTPSPGVVATARRAARNVQGTHGTPSRPHGKIARTDLARLTLTSFSRSRCALHDDIDWAGVICRRQATDGNERHDCRGSYMLTDRMPVGAIRSGGYSATIGSPSISRTTTLLIGSGRSEGRCTMGPSLPPRTSSARRSGSASRYAV